MAHDHKLRTPQQQQLREKYQKYLVTYESLVQSYRFSREDTHKIALSKPDPHFLPT